MTILNKCLDGGYSFRTAVAFASIGKSVCENRFERSIGYGAGV